MVCIERGIIADLLRGIGLVLRGELGPILNWG